MMDTLWMETAEWLATDSGELSLLVKEQASNFPVKYIQPNRQLSNLELSNNFVSSYLFRVIKRQEI